MLELEEGLWGFFEVDGRVEGFLREKELLAGLAVGQNTVLF